MTRVSVRYILGAIILVAHFGSIAMFGYLGLKYLDDFGEIAGLILSIAPLTTLYFTAFLHYVVGDDGSSDSVGMIPKKAFVVQLVVILAFCTALLPVGGLLFSSGRIDYHDIGIFTGLVETLFAGYLAIIFNSLFPESMTKRR